MSVNDDLLNDAVRHALGLQRLSNAAVRRMMAILNRSAAQIAAEMLVKLARMSPESFSVERLDALMEGVRRLNSDGFTRFGSALANETKAIADYELDYQRRLFEATIPPQVIVELPIASVNVEQVYAAAMARPFQGRLLGEWAQTQDERTMLRIRDAVRSGFVEQRTIDEIVRTVRGTRAGRFEDGILGVSRREAEAVVRTAISHTAGYARDRFMEAQDDLVKEVVWTSTLDSRTSPPCIVRDGLRYDNDSGHKPVGHDLPWGAGPGRFHWNCRSTSVPVVKSWKELGIYIEEFDSETRASMDGEVPKDLTYPAWLKKQPASVQDNVLGATRGKLFREGGFTVDKFVNRKGDFISLEELRAQDAAAFRKAGL